MFNLIIYFLTIASTQLLGFLMLPLISKNLSVETFGHYNLILSVAGLLGAFSTAWIRNVAFRIYYEARERGSSYNFVALNLAVQVLALLFLVAVMYLVAISTGLLSSAGLFWLSLLAYLVASDSYALLLNTVRAEEKGRSFSILENTVSVLRLVFVLVLVRSKVISPYSIVAAYSVVSLIGALLAWRVLNPVLRWGEWNAKADLKTILQLGLPALPLSVGGWVIAASDRLIIEKMLGEHDLGIYAANYATADRVMGGLVAALYMFLWPRLLNIHSKEPNNFPMALETSTRLYALITIGPMLSIMFFSTTWMGFLADERYITNIPIIPLIVASAWLSGLITYVNRPLEVQKQYGKMSLATTAAALINLMLMLLLTPKFGLLGAGLSTLTAYAASFILFCFWVGIKNIKVDWKDMGVIFLLATPAAYVLSKVNPHLIGLVIFAIGYAIVAGLLVLKRKESYVL